jgi:hypothetical protein
MSELGHKHARPDDLLARAEAAIRQSEFLKREVHASLDAAQLAMSKLHATMGEISRANLAGLAQPRAALDEDVATWQGSQPE